MGVNCAHQRQGYRAKPLLELTTYLYGGSGYPTLGCSRFRDSMRPLFSLFLRFLSLKLSLSLSPFFRLSKLHPLSLYSFLLFIAIVNGVIIIIFSLSTKKGPMSMGLSGFLGMSGLRNGSHFS